MIESIPKSEEMTRSKAIKADCSICNRIKGSKMFVNSDESRAYIKHRFGQKGYEYDFPRE